MSTVENETAWTFIHARTESGDDYYFVAPGRLADDEVENYLKAELGEEAEYVWDWYAAHTPVKGDL